MTIQKGVVLLLFMFSGLLNKSGVNNAPHYSQTRYNHSCKTNEKQEVPVLCYHNITMVNGSGITVDKPYFDEHMKLLADSGYQTIQPSQLCGHFTKEEALPNRPIIISFDDSRVAQYNIAAPILERYGFRGVFFIMTVCLNKEGYMSSMQLKDLMRRGHIIAAHTYDHPAISKLAVADFEVQLKGPKQVLERILEQPVDFFAYPNGTWSEASVAALKKYGYKAAFQLSGKQNASDPLYTIRRLMVMGSWSASQLHKHILATFN